MEGVWKWMTGPEAGSVFWHGGINGSAPTRPYANWPAGGESNNLLDEDYDHINQINSYWNALDNPPQRHN